ncbi:MAG: hypothetical protein IJ418_20980 [Clostridia bacterium]|nr:hypothetical protein [Clostridia bacterium]
MSSAITLIDFISAAPFLFVHPVMPPENHFLTGSSKKRKKISGRCQDESPREKCFIFLKKLTEHT